MPVVWSRGRASATTDAVLNMWSAKSTVNKAANPPRQCSRKTCQSPSLFGHQVNLPSELLWHGPHGYNPLAGQVPFFFLKRCSLLAVDVVTLYLTFCFAVLSRFPHLFTSKQALPLFTHSLKPATIPLPRSSIVGSLYTAALCCIFVFGKGKSPCPRKRRCTYIGTLLRKHPLSCDNIEGASANRLWRVYNLRSHLRLL